VIFAEVSQLIESPRFAAELNVLSGFQSAMRAVADSDEVEWIVELAGGDATVAQIVYQRIAALCSADTDPRYENPHDVGLFAYLFALNSG
jgi:hypothetical protein